MYLGNNSPLRYNQVYIDTRLLRVAYLVDHVSVHLNEFDGWDVRVLYPVVDFEVGVDWDLLVVGCCGTMYGYIPSCD